MHISFCIVNLNAKKYLVKCLRSIKKSTLSKPYEIIVVDNNSYDGSVDYIRLNYPSIRIIVLPRNEGYTKAMNIALQNSNGKYKVILNPDTELMFRSIDILLKQMQADDSIGIVGPKVINTDGSFQKSCRRGLARPGAVFSYFLGLSFLFPNNQKFTGYHLNHLSENELNQVSGVSGSCMVLKQSVINSIGYLDERYFAYQEDSDYCLRAINDGWKIYYDPRGVVIHHGGVGGAHSVPLQAIFEWHRSYYRYYKKHFSNDYSVLFNVFYYFVMITKLIMTIIKNLIFR